MNTCDPNDLLISSTEEVECGIGSDCWISLSCNRKRFVILLSRYPPSGFDVADSVEQNYLERLDSALTAKDEDEVDLVTGELSGELALLCQPLFRDMASVSEVDSHPQDLHALLNPQTIYLQMVTTNGKPKVIKRDGGSPKPALPHRLPLNGIRLPVFSPKVIKVLEQYKGIQVSKVSVGEEFMCCKIVDDSSFLSISREASILQQLADKLPSLRVPKLRGFVGPGKDSIFGIALSYIVPHNECHRLDLFGITMVAMTRRRKWARQISETVRQIHDVGLVWGDAKAGNVLVDEKDDAWIVDFGGSWTEGWVDPELADSIEGDRQGLARIQSLLLHQNKHTITNQTETT